MEGLKSYLINLTAENLAHFPKKTRTIFSNNYHIAKIALFYSNILEVYSEIWKLHMIPIPEMTYDDVEVDWQLCFQYFFISNFIFIYLFVLMFLFIY